MPTPMTSKKSTKADLKRGGMVQWADKLICIGVHYCEEEHREKFLDELWIDVGEKSKFYYAYDLTSYHVASGETSMKAVENLLHILWGSEVICKEIRQAGGKARRNKLHLEHPEALPGLWRAMHRWGGVVMGDHVDWRRLLSPYQRRVIGLPERSKAIP